MFSADLGGVAPAAAPPATDPPFQKVALLLHGDGTNGAQNNTFVDYSYPGGYAVSFDGTGDYLTVPSSSAFNFGSGDFTIEFWYYYDDSTTRCLLSIGNSTTTSINLVSLYGTYLLDWPTAYWASSLSIQKWNHVALVRAGTTFNCYINGTSTFTKTLSGSMPWASDYYVSIGKCTKSTDSSIATFKGFISNLRIVKGTALYTSNFTPSNLPLTAVSGTQLLTCQSATIVDNSPNAFTITANGDAAAVSSKTITRAGNVAQGTFSPFSLADGQWSNYFDGSGDYLDNTSNYLIASTTSTFTVEAWIYMTAAPTNDAYNIPSMISVNCGGGNNSVNYMSFGPISNQKLKLRWFDGAQKGAVGSTTLSLNTWYHVACSVSSNAISIYLNGVAETLTGDTTLTNRSGNANGFALGQTYTYANYSGYISNARVVSGTAVYTANFTPPTSALTAITNTSLLTCQSNRFKDNSSNNFTITRNGDAKVTAFSPFTPSAAYSASTNGGSGYFDGSGDYLRVTNPAYGTSDYTLEFWTYFASASGDYVFFDGRGRTASNVAPVIYMTTSSIKVDVATTSLISATAPNANAWHHIAVCRSGTSTRLFIDGVQAGSTASDSNNYASYTADIGTYFGSSFYLNGYLSNLRVVVGTALYTTTFTPPTAPLTAVANTQLLLNCTNAGIFDNASKNDIETVGNAQISTSVKKYGTGSMYFDGTGDNLKFQNNPASTPFGSESWTIEGWIYPNAGGLTYRILYTTGWPIQIYFRNSTLELYISSAAGSGVYIVNGLTGPASSIATSAWSHFAVVKNGSNYQIYVNGIGGTVATSSTDIAYPSSSFGVIGDFISGSYAYNGYIDDLRITKGQALYTSNFTPPTQAFPNV